jgi:hypothetical protein
MPLEFSHVAITVPLVPLDEAKRHLRITDAAHDADVTAIRDAAQDAIVFYLAAAADATWTDATVPTPVRHAIKLMMTHFYQHRGDDDQIPDPWPAIASLLGMSRDPTLA